MSLLAAPTEKERSGCKNHCDWWESCGLSQGSLSSKYKRESNNHFLSRMACVEVLYPPAFAPLCHPIALDWSSSLQNEPHKWYLKAGLCVCSPSLHLVSVLSSWASLSPSCWIITLILFLSHSSPVAIIFVQPCCAALKKKSDVLPSVMATYF